MTPLTKTALAGLALGLIGLQACRSSTPQDHPQPSPEGQGDATGSAREDAATRASEDSTEPLAVPVALDESIETRWQYLSRKYDGDGDGRIVYAEYARSESAFERLDRDGDGALSERDFAPRERRSMEERMQAMRAQRTLARHFQTAEDTGRLERAEVVAAFAAYDTSADGAIDVEEFTCGIEEYDQEVPGAHSRMVERIMGEVGPWEAFSEAIDADEDGLVTETELLAFFDANGREGVMRFSGGDGNRQARGDRQRPESGPAEGSVAPDFTLSPPRGGEAVTLSDFRGHKAVALVFGSYT